MSNCAPRNIYNITNNLTEFDADQLTPEECQAILQCIIDNGQAAQFEAFCAQLGLTLTVSTGPDDDVANATASEALDLCADETVHFYSPDSSILFTVSSGSAIVGAQLNPDVLAGITSTAITNIDLQPTANPNEFTVAIEWTDGDGNPQTTTDPTPITVAGGGDNYATANLTSTGTRTHSWQHSQVENFDGGAHERNYSDSQILGAGTHQISEGSFGRNVDLTGGPGQTANENFVSSEYFREIENGASGSTVEQSGGEFLVTARDNNNSTAGTGDLQISESRSAIEYTETGLLHNNGAPATTGFEARSEQVTGDQEPEPHAYLSTNNVSDGSANAGQVLSLIDPATGRVEYVDALTGTIDPASLISGEEGNTLRLGDDGQLYADPANQTDCFLEPVVVSTNGNTRNVGPDFDGLTGSHLVNATGPGGVPIAERITTLTGTIDNTGSGSVIVTNETTGQSSPSSEESWTGAFSSLTNVVFTLDTPIEINPGDLITFATVGSGGRWRLNFNTPSDLFTSSDGIGSIDNSLAGHFDGVIEHRVTAYDDGEGPKFVEFDENGDPQEIAIGLTWTTCGGLQAAGLTQGDIQSAQNDYVLDSEACYDTGVVDTDAEYTVPFEISNLDGEALPPFPTGPNIPPNNLFNALLDGSDGGDVFINYEIDSLTLAYVGTATGGDDGIFNVAGLGNTPDYVQDGPDRVLATWQAAPGTIAPSNRTYRIDGAGSHSGNLLVVPPTVGNQITASGGAAGNEVMGRLVGRVQPNIMQTVRTFRDLTGNGPDLVLDADGNPIIVEPSWALCSALESVGLTEQDIQDAVEICASPIDRYIVDTTNAGSVDFATGSPIPGLIPGADGSAANPDAGDTVNWPIHQAYIDDHIDYVPTGVQAGLDVPQDVATAGITDFGWIDFVVAAVGGETVSWSFAGEGYLRLEVAEGSCDAADFVIIDQVHSAIGSTDSLTHTLPAGTHRVRLTGVDTNGTNNLWNYDGDPIEFVPSSDSTPILVQLFQDCDGNLFSDAEATNPFEGSALTIEELSCPSDVKVKASNIIGVTDNTAPSASAPGLDSAGFGWGTLGVGSGNFGPQIIAGGDTGDLVGLSGWLPDLSGDLTLDNAANTPTGGDGIVLTAGRYSMDWSIWVEMTTGASSPIVQPLLGGVTVGGSRGGTSEPGLANGDVVEYTNRAVFDAADGELLRWQVSGGAAGDAVTIARFSASVVRIG